MKRVLVTGGAGFIGSNLALELERAGKNVVVLDNFSGGNFENLKGFNGDVVAADLVNAQEWVASVGAVDTIFHQAAITDTTLLDQRRMMQVNVEAFRHILGFALETGVSRVIYASSAGVYGAGPCPMKETQDPKPMNIYSFSKNVMETVAREFSEAESSPTVIGLRYFNVYGPRESYKGKVASMIWQLHGQMVAGRRPRVFKYGEQYRDFIYVKDVVDANLKAAESNASGVFNVCTGQKADFNKIISTLNEVLGKELKADYFDNPYSFYQNQTLGDPRAAQDALEFSARYSIEQGIRDYFPGAPRPAVASAV